jgi:hypothetical protein
VRGPAPALGAGPSAAGRNAPKKMAWPGAEKQGQEIRTATMCHETARGRIFYAATKKGAGVGLEPRLSNYRSRTRYRSACVRNGAPPTPQVGSAARKSPWPQKCAGLSQHWARGQAARGKMHRKRWPGPERKNRRRKSELQRCATKRPGGAFAMKRQKRARGRDLKPGLRTTEAARDTGWPACARAVGKMSKDVPRSPRDAPFRT